jgi:starch synthase
MKDASKILLVSQEIAPYLPDSPISILGNKLPQAVQEMGREMRLFMPRFGCINERRHQLHEVIRLSGINIIIDDTDHPLIIKVASIPTARIQVYFIDNEEFFKRKATTADDDGKSFEDNDDRTIFFTRGVIETAKKLRWAPDIVHCQGWMSALTPLIVKKAYSDDPCFKNSKIVYSIFDQDEITPFNSYFKEHVQMDGIDKDADLTAIGDGSNIDLETLHKLAIDYSDGVILVGENISDNVKSYIKAKGLPTLVCPSTENYVDSYAQFYDSL